MEQKESANNPKECALNEKNFYLVKELNPDRAYGLLSDRMADGYKGLCVTRTNPADIKKKYNLSTPVVWLTSQSNKKFATSSDMDELRSMIRKFIKTNKKSVVLLDRFDYLINLYDFTSFMKFIYAINDEVAANRSILVLNINPNTLSPQELSLLQQELQELPKPKPEAGSELPEDLYEILAFVSNSEKVSFKDVSRKFSITKTTTRKRINNLEARQLVTVRKNGRNKIVRMAETGKSLV